MSVLPGCSSDGVGEKAGKGGEGGEAQFEGDFREADLGVLHEENRLVGPVVF